MKQGYGIAFNEWLFDDRIKNELRLLIYISSLTAKDGICFASNEHFAEKFKTSEVTISRQINKLIKLEYLEAEYQRYGSVVQKRYLRLTKMITGRYQKRQPAVIKNDKYNSTSNNNTSINKEEALDFASIKDFYNSNCGNMPKCREITSTRKKQIKQRIEEDGYDTLIKAFDIAFKSDFLQGNNDRGFKADIEWITKKSNFVKILEGKYSNNTQKPIKENQPELNNVKLRTAYTDLDINQLSKEQQDLINLSRSLHKFHVKRHKKLGTLTDDLYNSAIQDYYPYLAELVTKYGYDRIEKVINYVADTRDYVHNDFAKNLSIDVKSFARSFERINQDAEENKFGQKGKL